MNSSGVMAVNSLDRNGSTTTTAQISKERTTLSTRTFRVRTFSRSHRTPAHTTRGHERLHPNPGQAEYGLTVRSKTFTSEVPHPGAFMYSGAE